LSSAFSRSLVVLTGAPSKPTMMSPSTTAPLLSR
jgi:hypothetical protein